ncbi:MAG: MOSC domain-containing protein [Kordiimonadaceae bacterium]|nr:MOSC domain-containing protein [Kordiimonadaceae bacterium]
MSKVTNIYRYPVKGLSGNRLNSVMLEAGKPVSHDREYAIALADSDFNPAKPEFMSKRNFLMLMRDEKLAQLTTEFSEENHQLIIRKDDDVLLDVSLLDADGAQKLGAFYEAFMEDKVKGTPRLVSAKGHMFADVPEQNLSLINLDSVRDIEKRTELSIDPRRFRGNLYVKGIGAWAEFDLIGKTFRMGDVTFKAVGRIDRCAAVNVNLETAERDMNIPLQIRKNYGHLDCGVYVDVVESGQLNVGDAISLD